MKNIYKLNKWIWTEKDFDQMRWHDSLIYSMSFFSEKYEFSLDIDYIFEWIHPKHGEKYFKFWIAPATIVFENFYDLILDLETSSGLDIDAITRKNPQIPKNVKYIKKDTEWTWEIECQQGSISFKSVGFKMYVNSAPILSSKQYLGLDVRGGINFTRGKT